MTSAQNRRVAMLLGALVVAALVLRVVAAGQALYGDEIFTHDDVVGRSFGSMLDRVEQVEDTPPLFFALAWLCAKLGDAERYGLRLPSLAAGVATVPLLYGIGRRLLSREAALLGAAIFAVSPFAVFYGSEARAYSLTAFLAVLSAYALLRALEAGDRRWWIAFAAAGAGALYTHYAAAAIVAGEVAWALAFHPRARGVVVAAAGAAALALVPWLALGPRPSVPEFAQLFPFTARDATKAMATAAVGHPFEPLHQLPGTIGLVLLAVGAVAVAAGVLRDRPSHRLSSGAWLVLATAVATPLAVGAYSGLRTSVFAPRNLYASLPFGCLLVAALVVAAGRLRAVAAAAVVAALLVTTARSEQADHQRPPFDDVAARLDHRPGRVAVLNLYAVGGAFGRHPLLDSLRIYLRDPRRADQVIAGDPSAYRKLAAGPRFNVVVVQVTGLGGDPPLPLAPPGYRLLKREVLPGFSRIGLYTFARSPS